MPKTVLRPESRECKIRRRTNERERFNGGSEPVVPERASRAVICQYCGAPAAAAADCDDDACESDASADCFDSAASACALRQRKGAEQSSGRVCWSCAGNGERALT